jgi:hypothetical protein
VHVGDPADLEYDPLGQPVQLAEPSSEYCPGQHGKHSDDPKVLAYVPAAQGVHSGLSPYE